MSASHTPTVSVTTIVFSPPQCERTERYRQARHIATMSASHTPTVSVTTIVFSPPQFSWADYKNDDTET
ncbi:hypothetical protein J6590_060987 [Homalodisca vitripennis]|nr:hypothetical protein J6590_060987 [Homalodisca vitripennis]